MVANTSGFPRRLVGSTGKQGEREAATVKLRVTALLHCQECPRMPVVHTNYTQLVLLLRTLAASTEGEGGSDSSSATSL